MRRVAVLIAILLALLGGVTAFFLLRPPVEVTSSVNPQITIECAAATSVSAEDCLDWGNGILSAGAPSTTFEMDDVARLRLTSGSFGLGPACQADFFLERYPREPVWTDEVECLRPDG